MPRSSQSKSSRTQVQPEASEVFSHLEQAEEGLLARETSWQTRVAELEGALEGAHETNRALGRHLEAVTADLEEERAQAERFREREERLREVAKELHRALFAGSVPEMILRACLTISGGTRGVYVSWRRAEDQPRVRAAVGVDGYPNARPSEYLTALCSRVRETHDTLVCDDASGVEGIPQPTLESEHFRNCAVVPALVQRDFDGVVLVADKPGEGFSEQDLEALLSVGDHASVALENAELHRELEGAYVSTITALAEAVQAKDPYTHGHCASSSRHARRTAERLGLSPHERAVICYAALLHDVGKIGVSDGVLNKPGPLLPEERELVRAHVRVGHDLIRNVPALEEVATAVLHHHEWFDGSGYPDGLGGEKIPMASRVVAVVDAFDAMITRRSYKEAYPESYAREELQRFAGRQFDPTVVEAFISALDAGAEMGEHEEDDCPIFPALARHREAQIALPVERA